MRKCTIIFLHTRKKVFFSEIIFRLLIHQLGLKPNQIEILIAPALRPGLLIFAEIKGLQAFYFDL